MSEKPRRRKKAKAVEMEDPIGPLKTVETVTEEATEKFEVTEETPEPEPITVYLPKTPTIQGIIVDVYCYQCQDTQPVVRLSVDHKGSWKFLLDCGHVECFEYKVELYGKLAQNRFGA